MNLVGLALRRSNSVRMVIDSKPCTSDSVGLQHVVCMFLCGVVAGLERLVDQGCGGSICRVVIGRLRVFCAPQWSLRNNTWTSQHHVFSTW